MNGRRVNILIPTFQPNDAVGNDVAGMRAVLLAAGFDARIYGEHIHPDCSAIAIPIGSQHDAEWRDPDALAIYHHAIQWELGEQILARSKNKIVVKYHNITPPEFFESYGKHYYWACVKGKESNGRIARIPNVSIWGDSAFNNEEFIAQGVPASRCRVVAPLHRIEEFSREPFDSIVLGAYRDAAVNILFVGGMRPNKGHTKALEVMAALRKVSALPFRLFLVGSFDPFLSTYTDDLEQYVRYLDLEAEVFFARSVTPSQLRSYYLNASVFLCVSEHEGFCVPVVEAMAFRVPVVAWATTAIGETVGGCGVVFDNFDAEAIAEGIAELAEDPAMAREFATRGRLRYETVFHRDAVASRLVSLVEEAFLQ